MWKWYTARDRREAVSTVLLLVIATVALIVAALLLPAWLLARPGLPVERLAGGLWALLTGRPVEKVWPGVTGIPYWPLVALGWVVVVAIVVLLRRRAWDALAPTGQGFATRTDVAKELSVAHAREKAAQVRPDIPKRKVARTPVTELAMPAGMTPWRQPVVLPYENTLGVFAPTQSGKSLMCLVHLVLGAPGACLFTSTKFDVFMLTALARERRTPNSVAVFDLTGSVPWHRHVRWNVIDGCTDLRTAQQRAEALIPQDHSKGSNHGWFVSRARDVLTCLLLAAALNNTPLARFVTWCQQDDNKQPIDILRNYPEFTPQRQILEGAQALPLETRGGVYETLRDSVAALADSRMIEACLPKPGETAFDAEAWLRSNGTIYVLGSEADAARQASLVTAFVQHVSMTAAAMALRVGETTGSDRLTPPYVQVLDELPNICPLPRLPDTMSDSAGRGIITAWAAQSRAQLQRRWSEIETTSLLDNTTGLWVFGGLKDKATLEWISALLGTRSDERVGTQSSGRLSIDRYTRTTNLERVSILEPSAVREIPRGRAVFIYRNLKGLIVRLIPAWTLQNWKQLKADADEIRGRNRMLPDAERLKDNALQGGKDRS